MCNFVCLGIWRVEASWLSYNYQMLCDPKRLRVLPENVRIQTGVLSALGDLSFHLSSQVYFIFNFLTQVYMTINILSQFYSLLYSLDAPVHSASFLHCLEHQVLLHTLSERSEEGEAGHICELGRWSCRYQFTPCTFRKKLIIASTEPLHVPGTVLSSLHVVS